MKRRLLTIFTTLSLVLLTAAVASLWRNWHVAFNLGTVQDSRRVFVGTNHGTLAVLVLDSIPTSEGEQFWNWQVMGIGYRVDQFGNVSNDTKIPTRHRRWWIDSHILGILSAVLPFWWAMRLPLWTRERRARAIILLVLSLLPSMAVGILWEWSYCHDSDRTSITLYDISPHRYDVSDYPGKIAFSHSLFPDPAFKSGVGPPPTFREFLGFETITQWGTRGPQQANSSPIYGSQREFRMPYWAAMTLATLLPLIFLPQLLRARRQSRRLRLGLCPTCAYDLRASKERCPECGQPIPAPSVHGLAQ